MSPLPERAGMIRNGRVRTAALDIATCATLLLAVVSSASCPCRVHLMPHVVGTAAQRGAPLSDVDVAWYSTSQKTKALIARTRTDQSGRFEFSGKSHWTIALPLPADSENSWAVEFGPADAPIARWTAFQVWGGPPSTPGEMTIRCNADGGTPETTCEVLDSSRGSFGRGRAPDIAPPPQADLPAPRLAFVGKITSIEAHPQTPPGRKNWVVTASVERVLTGIYHEQYFLFRVHSPSLCLLEKEHRYIIEAAWNGSGFEVDDLKPFAEVKGASLAPTNDATPSADRGHAPHDR